MHFYKYQGTGNDFILIDHRQPFFPKENTELIRQLCDRRFGIGADGLMLLESCESSDFRMVYYNADGRESTMCGNGGRCIAAFALQLHAAQEKGTFMAVDGPHEYVVNGNRVALRMIDVKQIKEQQENAYELFTGSPHYVLYQQDIDQAELIPQARSIRYNEPYVSKGGINVNLVEEATTGLKMRTYERGVEDETLSCGTGTVAVALTYAERHQLTQGEVDIHTPGGMLSVAFHKVNGQYTDIWLRGPAELVFEGTIEVDLA